MTENTENTCCCFGCDFPKWFNPRQKKYSRYCSRICQKCECVHRYQEAMESGEISAMQFGAMGIGENATRDNICACIGCSNKGWYDPRLMANQTYCSRQCRDGKCSYSMTN